MEFNREQIRKELILFLDDIPVELHLSRNRTSKFLSFLKLVLDLITKDGEKIFKLENRLEECENGYEGTHFLDMCKLHDDEQKIKELTEENERLKDFTKKQFKSAWTVREDTVRKMQERLEEEAYETKDVYANDKVVETVYQITKTKLDQIAEEILEGKNV